MSKNNINKKLKVLNLYAGIGGNRKLWSGDIEVTAVEYNEDIAKVYKEFYPQDTVIVGDAHEYLLKHYKEFDFIWSSPPCQSHSDIRKAHVLAGNHEAIYPDMKLYQEIIDKVHDNSTVYGICLKDREMPTVKYKKQVLRNMVNPEVGEYIFNCMLEKEVQIQGGLF